MRSVILIILFLIMISVSVSAETVANATITMKPPTLCTEGQQNLFNQADGTVAIKQCSGGDYTLLVDTCASMANVEYTGDGKYSCRADVGGVRAGAPPASEMFLGSLSTDVILLAILASILVVGGVVGLRLRDRPR